MRLTYTDDPNIDEITFKKLLFLCNELTFVNRPSVHLVENFGTVGIPSGINQLVKRFENSPIKLQVVEPVQGYYNTDFYQKYFEIDLANKDFIATLISGIEAGWIHEFFFDSKEVIRKGEFQNYKQWIIDNKDKLLAVDLLNLDQPDDLIKITDEKEAIFTFKIIASSQSLTITAALFGCNKTNSLPLSINPFYNRLITQRIAAKNYNGSIIKPKQLGIKLIDCLIPDKALELIAIEDILKFREKTKDYYAAFETELNKIEANLFNNDELISEKEVANLIDSDINPRLFELRNEIRRIKDDRFKSILKTIKNSLMGSIALGSITPLSIPGAIASFVGLNLNTPKLTDEIIDNHYNLRDKKKSNGMTYLLELQEYIN